MRTAAERKSINNFLGNRGFAQLNEPAALVQQLAMNVRDHDHFMKTLSRCEPEFRYEMYEALVPHLNFKAKPLGEYILEAALLAERQQLPTLTEDGGFAAFKVREVVSDEYIAEKALAKHLAEHHLRLTCAKCTVVAEFHGERKVDAIYQARLAGWTYDEINGSGREICPACPGSTKS